MICTDESPSALIVAVPVRKIQLSIFLGLRRIYLSFDVAESEIIIPNIQFKGNNQFIAEFCMRGTANKLSK